MDRSITVPTTVLERSGIRFFYLTARIVDVANVDVLRHSVRGPAIARRAQAAIQAHIGDGKAAATTLLNLAGGHIEDVKSEHVLTAARTGDALALQLVDETAYYMGWGIANLVNILNPDIVLLGTIAIAAGDLLLNPIRQNVAKFAMTRPAEAVKIEPAQLGDALGDLAAIALVV